MPAPGLTIAARAARSLALNLTNNDAANSVFFLEFNRERDFASDDTLLASTNPLPTGTTNINIPGLPGDTPFFVRARNSAGGAYSPLALGATTTTAPPAYVGRSVEPAAVVVPAELLNLAVGFSGGSAARAGFPVNNLLSDDPQASFQAINAGVVTLTWTTSGEPIDAVALLGTMIGDDTTWVVESAPAGVAFGGAGSTSSGSRTMRVSPGIGRRRVYHALFQLNATTTNTQWRVTINSAAPFLLLRNLVCGWMRESVNHSKGHTAAVNDLGAAARNRFGTVDRVSGWRGRLVDFELSWLNETDFHTKYAPLQTLVGKTKSVMVVVNTKFNVWMQDRIGFGVMSDIRLAHMQGAKYSAGLSMDSIY